MNDLLSLPRMARRIGVPAQWLREQVEAGQIPCLKLGKRYLFNPLAVQERLASRATQTLRPEEVIRDE